jgi:hypothetical protein
VSTDHSTKATHGGARKGAGRPSAGLTETIRARVTPGEKAKLEKLGGSEWIREQINRAR